MPGKEFSHTEELRVNWAKVLELTLNDGVCTVTGVDIGLKEKRRLEGIESFEEFFGWYKEELRHFLSLSMEGSNIKDRDFPNNKPYPFLSSSMQGCLEEGRYVTAGSTVYNFSTINGCGMANTANSLAAIQKLVYQDKKVTLSQLADMLHSSEALHEVLATKYPKFGNDDDTPDSIMRDLVGVFCDEAESHSNPRGGRFQTGLYTVEAHSQMGKLTGTLPDGRERCTALASGFSPSQGTDLSGPTAVVKSLTKLDHRLLGNGMVLDLKFSPEFFENAEKSQAFKYLVETYFGLGGMEIQFNVVDRETLLEAQKSPENYRDLIVRVSGFSAYFNDLARVTQDEIIARTEHFAV